MQLTSIYETTCVCGEVNRIERAGVPFTCKKCGIPGIVDFRAMTLGDLHKTLDGLDKQRDAIAKVIEIRRQKCA